MKNMKSLSRQLKNLSLSGDCYTGENLCNESNFLEKTKKIEEEITSSNCSFYFGKRVMTISVELSVTPTEVIASVLVNIVKEHFAKQDLLYKIGWCYNYMLDKRYHFSYLIEFAWFNISPNCRFYVKEGE